MAVDVGFMMPLTSGLIKIVFYAIGALLFLVGIFFFSKWMKNRKAYNIPVTIWIPRSDNKLVDEFSAVGGYFKSKAVGGITTFRIKRKGASEVDIEPPASRFLVGLSRHLYLVQKGMDDFEPVLPDSFMTVETAQMHNGKPVRKAIVNLKCINQDSTAWRFDNEANAKKRFTWQSMWEKYKDFLQITVFILIIFIACYMMWSGLGKVVAGLKEVAEILAPAVANAPMVS